jgi:hypothetical protein
LKQIIVLCGDQPNQWALVAKLNSKFPISDLIIWKPNSIKHSSKLFRIVTNPIALLANYPYRRAWYAMLDVYSDIYSKMPLTPSLVCQDVNELSVQKFLKDKRDVLLVVSGTNLLSQQLLEKLDKSVKVINLHTGLSPYVKGGPNCTNWCLALNRLDLIGNTVMWLDVGIDSGDIITSEQTDLLNIQSLSELQLRVMNHGHDLYLAAIEKVMSGFPVESIPQRNLGEGILFLTKDWTFRQKIRGIFFYYIRFKFFKSQNKVIQTRLGVSLKK